MVITRDRVYFRTIQTVCLKVQGLNIVRIIVPTTSPVHVQQNQRKIRALHSSVAILFCLISNMAEAANFVFPCCYAHRPTTDLVPRAFWVFFRIPINLDPLTKVCCHTLGAFFKKIKRFFKKPNSWPINV